MTMKRWDGASFIDLTVAKRWDGASWVNLTIAKRWDGASWIDIPLPGGGGGLSLTVSPGTASGFESRVGFAPAVLTVTSNSVTATPTGGVGPYTFSWARITGSSAPQANSPTSATTSWSANLGKNQVGDATWRCTVTDSLFATAFADVPVYLEYLWEPAGGGGGIPP